MQNPSTPVFHWGTQFAHKFDLSPFKTLLDVGCRQGNITAYLGKHYPQQQFTAIDNIESEIEQAKSHRLANVTFAAQDVLYLDCTNQFDAVVSFSCLHWIHQKAKVLQEIYTALKPGGKAFLQFFASHGRPKNDRFLYQTASASKWKPYFKHFKPTYSENTLTQLSALLQNTGFMIHRMEIDRYETPFEHPDALHQWFNTWASHLRYIPKTKQDHFLADTVSAYLNTHHYSDQITFPYYEYLLEIICEKPSSLYDEKSYSYANAMFTPHEIQVLKHFLHGKTAKEIGHALSISAKTSEFHLANIKIKLNCHKRSEIYQAAINYGFIDWLFNVLE